MAWTSASTLGNTPRRMRFVVMSRKKRSTMLSQDVLVGVIDVASDVVETPEEVADTIGRALEFVPKERLFPCTNCGLAPMSRDVAWRKLKALAEGTRLAKERLATA